ncbi:MAG: aminotransferase class V-fold PLP-dependent enzyme [Deltaproteobacteria bacterium]|nr:MAG: aminotransferase class V-fold PLP-dependent enzyme [Deltaproteobacteria bacterium]
MTTMSGRSDRLDRFARAFIGLDRVDPVFDGPPRRRVYLDTTATALMPNVVWDGLRAYFDAASANSHTDAHRAGRDTTQAIEDSRDAIGRLVGYDPDRDVVLFTANGATGATNFLARALFPPELRAVVKRFPDGAPPAYVDALATALGATGREAIAELIARPVVVTTTMEHHSNLLPWMEAVGHQNVVAARVRPDTGELDLDHLAELLARHGPRVRLVAVTAVSNVTGICNPVRHIARMAHEVGAEILIDGAQWVPHAPVRMHSDDPAEDIDYLVLSGHKLYAPGSRGALVGKLATLSARRCVTDVGGGMVEYVSIDDFAIKDQVTAREEAGTPNIPGSIAMGLVAEALMAVGMEGIAAAERALTTQLIDRLLRIDGVAVYGSVDLDRTHRAGVVSFNVDGLPHGLVAAYLNDFHNIAVRNGCFCAQPYVKALLRIDEATERATRHDLLCGDRRNLPGMVRASLGVYSTRDDIEALGAALEQLVRDRERIASLYRPDFDGTFRRIDGQALPRTFCVADAAARSLAGILG